MTTYYSSLTRIFSIFFGITLGLVHYFYKPMVIFEKKNIKNGIFYFYMLVLLILSIFMKTNYYVLGMIITTLISCRLIDYGVSLYNKNDCCNKAIKTLSGISYEVYLVQYPIIYFFQDVSMNCSTTDDFGVRKESVLSDMRNTFWDFDGFEGEALPKCIISNACDAIWNFD